MKKQISLLALLLVFLCLSAIPAHAQKAADTSGLQFTSIPTAADSIAIKKAQAKKDAAAAAQKASAAKANGGYGEVPKTLWEIFIAGFLGGLLAVTMPCIYPMLPLTVSFFTKKAGSKAKAVGQSFLYGVSIIVIYVALGLVITLVFGSNALNALATNGIFNFFFFLLLVVFGISFLGAFEITLPSSLANKLDANSDKGGLAGLFFMAATLVVVSFSCTGPIIGSLLVEAASKGQRLAPAMGMFGFSLALAIPFVLFALFPSALKSLPKSGGWLNSVKVVLGFLELAFALKFLSNVDLAYHWNIFDREIFLALWIAIGLLIVLYLIGKIKFANDSTLDFISIPRIFITIIVLSFVVYMIPGMWGAPLKSISAFLPPPATQDFNLYNLQLSGGVASAPSANLSDIGPKKYADGFTRGKVMDLEGWYDYDQALQVSQKLHKPILLDFTGWNCVNCRKMENNVWSNPTVHNLLKNEFVLVEAYVDDKKVPLEKNQEYTSSYSGKKISLLGDKWSDIQASRFNSNSQPDYVILNSKGEQLLPAQGADYNPDDYIKFLNAGLAEYKKNNGSN
ncbi:thioredoxin family protein [uncultured Mucilaginibacter sp.]|uniref:protein-disulfide reductase DsbD family protein n=1 Tax=uncultured Mucilaginibacter sp. TaxID=797541 RepID=UPI0025F1802B|nr:thioredoxin family protein [uncultured Mucilaginibacter sp.]